MTHRLPLLVVVAYPGWLAAQGVTTAATQGTVTGEDGRPIAEASVRVVHSPSGRR